MNATLVEPATLSPSTDAAIAEALGRIPPLWPLEHFVATNPFQGLADRPFAKACAILRRTLGRAPVQRPADYLAAWNDGRITRADLAVATDEDWPAGRLLQALDGQDDSPLRHPVRTFAELLDETLPHAHWSGIVTEEIAKWCGVHYDRNQTTWISPWRHLGLFAAWKTAAVHDRKPEVSGIAGFRAFVRTLPDDPQAVIRRCLAKLDPQGVDAADFLHRQLATVSGWAGHVQWRVREDALRGNDNPALLELLAIRLAYDAALHDAFGGDAQIAAAWRHQSGRATPAELDEALARWQTAYEAGYQRELAAQLVRQPTDSPGGRPAVQAVFCIDVRSEIVRRHLESALPGTRTLGFAGFFGFPVAHESAGSCQPVARCPALLAPPVLSREPRPPGAARLRAERGAWKAFQNSAASCFSYVETLGLTFSAGLFRRRMKAPERHAPAPGLVELGVHERAMLAGNALRGMGLTGGFARIVLLCGHGSHSSNNPFASSLDCGACGGHGGEVNARLAASTLNDPAVRAALALQGIVVPEDTHFLAARHDTLDDEFQLFDLDAVPPGHGDEVECLAAALRQAGAATRRERAAALGLEGLAEGVLDEAIRTRGLDIAQVRPEWGLANNAALIAAPRARTAALKLDGRVFLHEYDPAGDPDAQVLTAILTAPVVVASWINLQYYASRIDPAHFSAGDKTIHQVVAGLGVIEGNAGDLRPGLPLQSIHDGSGFVHEPRRLTVFVESEPSRIDAVLAAHPGVKQLFDHGWIHLIALHGRRASRRSGAAWLDVGQAA
jgi:uncharacterized protein YbcC (UPF0753/DUF2309 family)